jgi:hypothetical protein
MQAMVLNKIGACGGCPYCLARRKNLCDHPLFTGFTRDGGGRQETGGLWFWCRRAYRGAGRQIYEGPQLIFL